MLSCFDPFPSQQLLADAAVCGEDRELREEVESLLAAHKRGGDVSRFEITMNDARSCLGLARAGWESSTRLGTFISIASLPSKCFLRNWETWKVSAAGGEAVPVTRNGGGPASESHDGRTIYYIKGGFSGGLWKMLGSGGEESQVLASAFDRAFCLVNEGIYFMSVPVSDQKFSVQFLSFATGKLKTV